MINIQFENPSIEQYIKEIGKENLETMILSFLEIKAKLNQVSKKVSTDDNYEQAKAFGLSLEVHQKILALKPKVDNRAEEMNNLIDKISAKMGNRYSKHSDNKLRDEYFQSKGYL